MNNLVQNLAWLVLALGLVALPLPALAQGSPPPFKPEMLLAPDHPLAELTREQPREVPVTVAGRR